MKSASTLLALLLWTGPAFAGEDAREIASRALENNTFSAANARAEVALEVSKEGKVRRTRRITTKIKRKDGVVRSFVEFQSPADVAGTRFLSVEERGNEAEQFIYLPAFKKVKRVVGSQRTKSFMGTDFSFSDLDGREVDDAEWKQLPDEKHSGEDCFVIQGLPKSAAEAEYGKTIFWVHKTHLVPMRIDFFDKDGKAVVKRFLVKKLEKKNERWLATDAVMSTLAKNTSTRLQVLQVDLQSNIPDEELTRNALER
jgi:hypothetical protein